MFLPFPPPLVFLKFFQLIGDGPGVVITDTEEKSPVETLQNNSHTYKQQKTKTKRHTDLVSGTERRYEHCDNAAKAD